MSTSPSSQKAYLFTDLRHILCGDLEWYSPEGDYLPTTAPPEPPVEARAVTGFVPHGIRLVAQQANKTEPMVPRVKIGRVIYEDGLYRSWYFETEPPAICYIESKDGFDWTEPRRSPIEVQGRASHELAYFIDPHGPPEERYKAMYPSYPTKAEWPALWKEYQKIHPRYREPRFSERGGQIMCGAVSPDGVRWRPLPEPLMVHFGDTDNTVYYDAWLERYVMYTRLYIQGRRWIGRAEAEDFRHWGPVEPLIWPNLHWPYSYDIYSNGRTEYPGLPGYHLMFPWIYQRYTQTGSRHLYSSADGICWNEVPGGPVISVGEPGEPDGEYVGGRGDLVPLGSDRIGVVSGGTGVPHKYPRWRDHQRLIQRMGVQRWAWWPKGRLCALVAEEEGEFFTLPVIPAGRELRLNVRVRRAGEVRVGLLVPGEERGSFHDRHDVPERSAADCDLISANELAVPVHWKGQADIGVREGEAVTLHFKLRAAELFGFEWV